MKSMEIRRMFESLHPRLFLGAAALAAVLFTAGCIMGREDAEEIRDENLFIDVVPEQAEGGDREEAALDTGEEIREWSDMFGTEEVITLADCFRHALARTEELAIQGERILVTIALEREAIAELLPEILFNWGYRRDSDSISFGGQTISPRNSVESRLTVRQTIFDGRSLAAVPAARAARKIERLLLRDDRDRLLFAVAVAFYTILGLEYDVQVFKASLASSEEFYRVVEARRKSGEASKQESMTAKAQRDLAEAQLIQTRHDVMIARSRLARLIGLTSLPAALEDTYEVGLSPGNLPDLVEAANDDRYDLEAARSAIELAKADRLAVLAEYFPIVSADFTYWLDREGAFSSDIDWTFSLNLAWSLFDSGGREARQSMALSRIRQRVLELSSLEKEVRFEVEEAVYSFWSLSRSLGVLKSRTDASRSALDLADAEYRANEITNLDVIIARRVWEEAERDYSRARLSRKLAALKIRLVVGDFRVTAPVQEAVKIEKE